RSHGSPYCLCLDMHWEKLQPMLSGSLNLEVRPTAKSKDAWHFGRHNFACWDLTDFELLECVALSGGTKATIERKRVTFANREIKRTVSTAERGVHAASTSDRSRGRGLQRARSVISTVRQRERLAPPKRSPAYVGPMKALLVEKVPKDSGW